jgi:hypothetical protein
MRILLPSRMKGHALHSGMLHDQTMDAFPVVISAKRANPVPLERHTAPSQTKNRDRDAYLAHLQAPRFLKYKATVEKMVKSLKLVPVEPIMLGAKAK